MTLNPDPERGEQSQVTHTRCPFRVPNPLLPPPHHTAISLSYNYYQYFFVRIISNISNIGYGYGTDTTILQVKNSGPGSDLILYLSYRGIGTVSVTVK